LNFSHKELLLFDFDGTLIDSVPDLAHALNHMLKTLNRETFKEDTIRFWVGNGAHTLVKRALLGKNEIDDSLDETLFEDALKIFLDFYTENVCVYTLAYPGVVETIKTLQQKGYILAIITNKPYAFINPILEGLGMSECFTLLLGADSLAQKKPHPQPLLYACENLNIKIENAIMVGDSKNDILAAHSAKMDSIGVSYGYNYGEHIEVYKPSLVVDNFMDILERL
jgi:phosphoglycolate phosphatase